MFQECSIPQALPGPTLWMLTSHQASHTQPEKVTELLVSELLPPTSLLSVTNKQTNTSSANFPNQRPESRGPQGQGQPWSPRRGRANRKMTKVPRHWRGQKIDFVFLFLFLFCWACLTVHGCRIGMGPSHKPSVKMCVCVCVCVCLCVCVCVFKYIKYHKRPRLGWGPGASQALSESWLIPPLGQEDCWRAVPT